jgi:hypothetical protein
MRGDFNELSSNHGECLTFAAVVAADFAAAAAA